MSLYHGGQQPPHDPTVPPDISQQQWGAPAGAVADAAAHAVHQLQQQQQQQQQQLPGVPNVPHFPAGPGQGGANSVATPAAAAAAAVAAPAPAGLSTIAAAAQQAYSTYNPNAQYVQHPPSWQTQQPRPPQLVPPQQSQAQQPQPQQQLFICPQCNKGLKSQAGLTSHMQVRPVIRPGMYFLITCLSFDLVVHFNFVPFFRPRCANAPKLPPSHAPSPTPLPSIARAIAALRPREDQGGGVAQSAGAGPENFHQAERAVGVPVRRAPPVPCAAPPLPCRVELQGERCPG